MEFAENRPRGPDDSYHKHSGGRLSRPDDDATPPDVCLVGDFVCLSGGTGNNGMLKLVMIAAGGAAGALLRYAATGWAQKLTDGSFPAGTLVVNLLGCFLIGALGALFAGPHLIREEYRIGCLVGLIGAFTTFSTYGWETFALANEGQMRLAVVNIVLSNGVGLVAVWLGYRVAEKWFGV